MIATTNKKSIRKIISEGFYKTVSEEGNVLLFVWNPEAPSFSDKEIDDIADWLVSSKTKKPRMIESGQSILIMAIRAKMKQMKKSKDKFYILYPGTNRYSIISLVGDYYQLSCWMKDMTAFDDYLDILIGLGENNENI